MTMKVILLKNVNKLGQAGDVKEVNEGYARNFLLPQRLAEIATKHSINVKKNHEAKLKRQEIKKKNKKENLFHKIKGKSFEIKARADEKGTLYAGLDSENLSGELKKQGFEIDPEEILLKEKIKSLGEYDVDLKISNHQTSVKITIIGPS